MSSVDPAAALASFRADLAAATDLAALEEVRRQHAGKKSPLRTALGNLRALPPEQRKEVAAAINEANATVESELEAAQARLAEKAQQARLDAEWMDLSMPGVATRRGARHPLTEVERRCLEVMRQLGFALVEGPEVESPYYNFDALNIPEHHPARDMQDTFYVEGGLVLRTHTTSVQARVLSKRPPLPIRVVSMGRVYRNEAVDATHLAMFHQFEGIWLEEGLDFAHLKGVLAYIVDTLYGGGRLRFKPKFYPYTEPSVGVDLQCSVCEGTGEKGSDNESGGHCPACHGSGWVTILGAGMVHPKLLVEFGYDPDRVGGIAFGLGTTRMAAQAAGINALRPLYVQDLPLLQALHRGGRA